MQGKRRVLSADLGLLGTFFGVFQLEILFTRVALFAGLAVFMGGSAAFMGAFLTVSGRLFAAGLLRGEDGNWPGQ